MNKTRHQIYYQNNQEKLKRKRKIRYQLDKLQKEKILQKERKRLEKWKIKLHVYKEACLYFPRFSTYWKLDKVQEKVQKIEVALDELNKKLFK